MRNKKVNLHKFEVCNANRMLRSVYSTFTSIYEFSVALRLIPTPLPNNSISQAYPIRRVANNRCHEDVSFN